MNFKSNRDNGSGYPQSDLTIHEDESDKLKGSADDVFFNNLDLTWMKSEHIPSGDYSRVLSKLPVEGAADDGEVEYIYNKNGFRSGEFSDNHDGKKHVLFMGCSETEGYGGSYGEFWSSILYDTIAEKNELSGFFNLARGGWGWEKIIANSTVYFDKYGIPDYMFIMLPNIARYWQYFQEDGQWAYIQRYTEDHLSNRGERTKAVLDYKQKHEFDRSLYFSEFVRFIAGWKLYLRYCESLNIKVLWSTWLGNDGENIKGMYNFDNFVYMGTDAEVRMMTSEIAAEKKQSGTLKKNDVRRRDGHHGTITHRIWSEKFLARAAELGWDIV
jgi:hypothetical protein